LYYIDFKLLLCSICNIAISKSNIEFHFSIDYFQSINNNQLKKQKKIELLQLLLLLNISDLKSSYDLICLFANQFLLFAFSELKIIDTVYKCNYCNYTLFNKKNMQKHCKKNHSSFSINNCFTTSKSQSLKFNKYYFTIESSSNNNNNTIVDLNSDNSLFKIASDVFKSDFLSQKAEINKQINLIKINKQKKLTSFQIKTRYIEFITVFNRQQLVDLVDITNVKLKIEILLINIQKMLYLNLKKVVFLNKIHLNVLNSFKHNKI
jgi:hypothetical protein